VVAIPLGMSQSGVAKKTRRSLLRSRPCAFTALKPIVPSCFYKETPQDVEKTNAPLSLCAYAKYRSRCCDKNKSESTALETVARILRSPVLDSVDLRIWAGSTQLG